VHFDDSGIRRSVRAVRNLETANGVSDFPPLASARLETQLQIQFSNFQHDTLHLTLFRKRWSPGANDGNKNAAIGQQAS
jgi:hypothetical protein